MHTQLSTGIRGHTRVLGRCYCMYIGCTIFGYIVGIMSSETDGMALPWAANTEWLGMLRTLGGFLIDVYAEFN